MAETVHNARLLSRVCLKGGLLIALAGACAALVSCDEKDAGATIAKASNQLRIAPALGVDEEGNDLIASAYGQAASTAQGSKAAGAGLIAAGAVAAQAQQSLKAAVDAWQGITSETASGQALLLRLANEKDRLADLEAFDPSAERAEISSRRTKLQQDLRAMEGTIDELNSSIANLEQSIQNLRSQARSRRDAAEELRERAVNIGGTQRATLIEQSNTQHRQADGYEKQAATIGLQLERVGFQRGKSQEQHDKLRKLLEELMQRERNFEASVANRSQQVNLARENIAQLSSRIAGQINTMAQWYNAEIAPAIGEAIAGFESAASKARQDQAAGSSARLSIGSSEHALASTHRTHAGMLESMLSFVDMSIARGVTGGPIDSIRKELHAKLNEATAAANAAAEQASASLSGAGVSGAASEALNAVSELLRPAGSSGSGSDDQWQDESMSDPMDAPMDEPQDWQDEPSE